MSCPDLTPRPGDIAPGPPAEDQPELVDHPAHYNGHPSGVECIDVVEHFSFNRGNAIKYIWRAGDKGGPEQEVEDLEKAIWYLQRELSTMQETRK